MAAVTLNAMGRKIITAVIFLSIIFLSTTLLHANPINGQVSVDGVVQAPPPDKAAVITVPKNGASFSSSPIDVKGTCVSGTTIELYKNGVFAGSAPCLEGSFSLKVDLLFGKNVLLAKTRDSLEQYGPDSKTVTVSFTSSVKISRSVSQLLLLIDAEYRGVFPGQVTTIKPGVFGGTPPYALKIDWGDSSEEIVPRQTNGYFELSHTYQEAGTKQVKLQVSDSRKQNAFIQTVVIVNGRPSGGGDVDSGERQTQELNKERSQTSKVIYLAGPALFLSGIGAGIFIAHYRKKM